ncbi:hypothetical protein Pmani_008158 [Petrolisthes manimaculis]|uniref:Uncharacterized protein n=1 Tax=Petrolisthes manimaculis TaxID=1843537 RepID=A0AAE1UJW8_9EUCA|nr:hypothetical protein Pmani_008158 [Petrolisthes manimaculis]
MSSEVIRSRTNEIIYNFTSGHYEEATTIGEEEEEEGEEGDEEERPKNSNKSNKTTLLHLLTLPSRVALREDVNNKETAPRLLSVVTQQQQQTYEDSDLEDVLDDSRKEMEELYHGVVSKEELARIDAQPNPFNFSDRVSQTVKIIYKELAIQTQPPPDTRFSLTVGPGQIHEAYRKHEEQVERNRKEKEERDKDKERGKKKTVVAPLEILGMRSVREKTTNTTHHDQQQQQQPQQQEEHYRWRQQHDRLGTMHRVARVVERMVTQNIYDDILQDFKYWEDGSDEYRPLQGSLLPLWRFRPDQCRRLTVSDLAFSAVFPDIFAAAYTSGDGDGSEAGGLVCVFTLKNPASPDKMYPTPTGATSLHFHPTMGSLLAAGCSDGTIMVYDVSPSLSTPLKPLYCTTFSGKHLLPVTKVAWLPGSAEDEARLVSISLDGRVTTWLLHDRSQLQHSDVLVVKARHQHQQAQHAITLDGVPTSLAVHPELGHVVLLGVDTGAVYQCSTSCLPYSLLRYPAHHSQVTCLAWNSRHPSLFLSASLDWSLKIWLQHCLTPLVVVDCGGSVAGASWSPYNTSVVVAVTEDCCAHVFDLFARRCRPVCVQPLAQRRPLSAACLALSPFYPVILVGGERGHLASFKLSPNLRRRSGDGGEGGGRDGTESRGGSAGVQGEDSNIGNQGHVNTNSKEIERGRMETLIQASKA